MRNFQSCGDATAVGGCNRRPRPVPLDLLQLLFQASKLAESCPMPAEVTNELAELEKEEVVKDIGSQKEAAAVGRLDEMDLIKVRIVPVILLCKLFRAHASAF